MPTVHINGRRRQLAPAKIIGAGGEADIYDIGGGQVLKLFKQPNDPVYTGNMAAQTGARERLKEYQRKLAAFPSGLPQGVIAPMELAFNGTGGMVAGYTMRYMDTEEVLLRLSDRAWRDHGGIDANQTVTIFRNLRDLVRQVHQAGMVIGDFNDLNVMFDGTDQVYLIDADSMQFGGFLCRTFTSRFVDPLLCEADRLVLSQPHNQSSDWYAFTVILMQSLLFAGPYGGVHKPTSGKRMQHDERVLNRITVWSPDVVYPKPALPYANLPDELLDYFSQVYQKDLRGDFPERLLDNLRWTVCGTCGIAHARPVCPVCAAPGVVKQTVVRRGAVTATRTFVTRGQILFAVSQHGELRYLYHENGVFRREDDREVVKGTLDPELRYRISGQSTLFGKRDRLIVADPGSTSELTADAAGRLTVFDANSKGYFWTRGGQLLRSGKLGSQYVGSVLEGRTLIWTGERFGAGLYQAGDLRRAFVFDSERPGLNDRVPLPAFAGQLIDAACAFSADKAWLMLSLQENGKLINRCFVISRQGELIASGSAGSDEDSWLAAGIRGRFAQGSSLFAATDEGIIRVGTANGSLQVEQTFPDAEPFVNASSRLLPASDGIYAVSAREITLLKIK